MQQPPRRASAQPKARHVGCFGTAVGVPRFDPRPEGKEAGVQNAGDDGSRWSPLARWRSVVRTAPTSRGWVRRSPLFEVSFGRSSHDFKAGAGEIVWHGMRSRDFDGKGQL
jgi:hypothetical protein